MGSFSASVRSAGSYRQDGMQHFAWGWADTDMAQGPEK